MLKKSRYDLFKNKNFFRVGDCFDPIPDPTPDCNPFGIAIRLFRIAIGNPNFDPGYLLFIKRPSFKRHCLRELPDLESERSEFHHGTYFFGFPIKKGLLANFPAF